MLIADMMESIFSDPVRLRKLRIASDFVMSLQDVADWLGKDAKTVRNWHKNQRHGFYMLEGPDGDLTKRYSDLLDWYHETYKRPRPKVGAV